MISLLIFSRANTPPREELESPEECREQLAAKEACSFLFSRKDSNHHFEVIYELVFNTKAEPIHLNKKTLIWNKNRPETRCRGVKYALDRHQIKEVYQLSD